MNIFKKRPESNDRVPIDFELLDLDEILSEIDLENEARRRGKKNTPMTDATEPDEFERRILNTLTEKVKFEADNVRESTTRIRDDIANLSLEPELQEANAIASDLNSDLQTKKHNIERSLQQARNLSRQGDDDLAEFKRQNKLRRAADYPYSQLGVIGALLLMLLLEAGLNGFFFAEGSDLGLVGGWMEATIIAFINVFFGFLIGKFILPLKNAVHTSKRFCGRLLSGIMIPLAFLFNLLVGHYRSAFTEHPDIAKEISVNNFLANPLDIGDVHSWFLVFLGMMFFFVAIYKGYRSDDAYPGYGRVTRLKIAAEEIFDDEIKGALEDIEYYYNSSLEKLESTRKEAERKNISLHANTRILDQRLRRYGDFERHANEMHQALVCRYRELNTSNRNTPPPRHFSIQANDVIVVEPVSREYIDKREEFQKQKQEFDTRMPELRKQLQEVKMHFSNYVIEIAQQ